MPSLLEPPVEPGIASISPTPSMLRETAQIMQSFQDELKRLGILEAYQKQFYSMMRTKPSKPFTPRDLTWGGVREKALEAIKQACHLYGDKTFHHPLIDTNAVFSNIMLHSYLPFVDPDVFLQIADVIDSGERNPSEVLLELCSSQSRNLKNTGKHWRFFVSGLFDLYVSLCHRTTSYAFQESPESYLRHLSVFDGVYKHLRYSQKTFFSGSFAPKLRQNACEIWEDNLNYCLEGRTKADLLIKNVERTYNQVSPKLFDELVRNPKCIGAPKNSLEEALVACGPDGLKLVQVFRRRWRDYFESRFRREFPSTEHYHLYSDEPESFKMRSELAHDLISLFPPDSRYSNTEGLGEYLIRYDYRRWEKYLRAVTVNWNNLTAEEKQLDPLEAFHAFCSRTYQAKIDLSNPFLVAELAQWLPQIASDSENKTATDIIRLCGDYYDQSISVPLPKWATGTYKHGGLTGRFLPRQDGRGLFIGCYTKCCQHVGGQASDCSVHAQTSPYACNFVIELKDQIVANSWVFEGEDERIVFDNVEGIKQMNYNDDIVKIIQEVAQTMKSRLVTLGTAHTKLNISHLDHQEDIFITPPFWWPKGYLGTYTDARNQVILADNRKKS